jgi:DNA repair exonuclease SbcCD ATPase subunit
MQVGKCLLHNFGSYRTLEFDFANQGLTLIHGATGSGKSTLQDAAAWCMFGLTAKGGAVDEIRNWANLSDPTEGYLEVNDIEITRIRGKGQNDLYWTEVGSEVPVRGKDIPDTQRLLEARLGVTADLYLLSAYFHEFSSSASFFAAKAKERRTVFEGVANLSLPTILAERTAAERKTLKATLQLAQNDISGIKGGIKQAETAVRQALNNVEAWKRTQAILISSLTEKSEGYASQMTELSQELKGRRSTLKIKATKLSGSRAAAALAKNALELLDSTPCSECGAPKEHAERAALVDSIHSLETSAREHDRVQVELARVEKDILKLNEPNPHAIRLEEETKRTNPHRKQAKEANDSTKELTSALQHRTATAQRLEADIHALTTLNSLSSDLRGELVKKAVADIEEGTNNSLDKYFDAEIRVQFTLSGSDNLDVEVFKSGYECTYRQLSKGQRGMLRLAFCTALMEVAANNSGVRFSSIFLDESMDGLDVDLKVKAFGLLQELATRHDSVFVIDHSEELKAEFTNKYHVKLVADESVIA